MKKSPLANFNCAFNSSKVGHWWACKRDCLLWGRPKRANLVGWFWAILSVLLSGSKGEGELKIGALHKRFSHGPFGEMTIGAQTLRDSKRQEIFAYFHPGDLKPPLNIYFSGVSSGRRVWGLSWCEEWEAPFILFSDPRLEGGSFYMGSQRLEDQIVAYIDQHLDWLGFGPKRWIFQDFLWEPLELLYYGASLLASCHFSWETDY